jgi:hypothetical protein
MKQLFVGRLAAVCCRLKLKRLALFYLGDALEEFAGTLFQWQERFEPMEATVAMAFARFQQSQVHEYRAGQKAILVVRGLAGFFFLPTTPRRFPNVAGPHPIPAHLAKPRAE